MDVGDIYRTVFLLLGVCIVFSHLSCVQRDYGNGGTVCVCNATYCDYLQPISKIESPNILIYTSNQDGLRFLQTTNVFRNSSSGHEEVDIKVTYYRAYQTIAGFGGAFTDATGINIGRLSDDAKEHLLRSYFAKDGIEYNLCRIPIGGTDFSTEGYSYDDSGPDPELKKFALNHADIENKIPYINVAQNFTGGNLNFFASAWTAPKWMKTNGEYVGGAIKPDMYQAWADYHVKFLNVYKNYGIKFWGITTGNEPSMAKFPMKAIVKLNSVGWTATAQAKWVAENLGPTLNRSGYSQVKIMALDDQRFYLPWFMDSVFKNERAMKYIDGTAVHWYWDKLFPSSLLWQLHNKYPDKFIISTEACKGSMFWSRGVKLGDWSRAEDYATDIIEDLQNWVIGWVDWNMALNETGGPTYIDNIVDSPIIVNATSNEFYKQPMFYALGHFSKFIPRSSVVIDSGKTSKVNVVAVRRPDKGVTIVILNKKSYAQTVTIADTSKGTVTLNVSAHSITSVIYW